MAIVVLKFSRFIVSRRPVCSLFQGKLTSLPVFPSPAMAEKRKSDASNKSSNQNGSAKKKAKESIPDVTLLDFTNDSTTEDGQKWNFKLASWNINGIRAWLEKNGHSYIKAEDPDIFCVQETKCDEDKIPDDVKVEGYHCFWSSAEKSGYAGTGIYSKTEPLNVTYGIGEEKHDEEGRVITAEYEKFYLVTAYVPNAGRGLVRLDYRKDEWDPAFRKYLKDLDDKKPVILCGDLNVAHTPIDLAKPKNNKKSAGFTEQERQGFSDLLSEGFVDSFRKLYPEKEGAYTFWTYMMNARGKDIGWRLDYFVISEKLLPNLCDSVIRKEVMGSDHCPITTFLHLKKPSCDPETKAVLYWFYKRKLEHFTLIK